MFNKYLKNFCLICCLTLIIGTSSSCKKDQLDIDTSKSFYEIDHVSQGPFDSGWQLTLNPDQTSDIIPGGDIIYRGNYKIKGDKLIVKADQLTEEFEFKIISKNEIKEKKYGVRLTLTSNIN